MKRELFHTIESYMFSCMDGSAHDTQHVYRVLWNALDIAATETDVDYDILITACLLHDIGRPEQLADPSLCHARVGEKKAEEFLIGLGMEMDFVEQVCHCIRTHRFSNRCTPRTIEAMILFDADKLDVTGLLGVARTLQYQGQKEHPLYHLREDGMPGDGTGETKRSFFQEYKRKLEPLYDTFYTAAGAQLARQHKQAAEEFYHTLYRQICHGLREGKAALENILD